MIQLMIFADVRTSIMMMEVNQNVQNAIILGIKKNIQYMNIVRHASMEILKCIVNHAMKIKKEHIINFIQLIKLVNAIAMMDLMMIL